MDEDKNFVVFGLKLSRSADRAVGQILRYISWVKKHLSRNRKVKGVIVAEKVDDKLKYAASVVPEISLFEYKLDFKIKEVSIKT